MGIILGILQVICLIGFSVLFIWLLFKILFWPLYFFGWQDQLLSWDHDKFKWFILVLINLVWWQFLLGFLGGILTLAE